MTRAILVRPAASNDLFELIDYLALRSSKAAQRLRLAAESSILRLSETPDLGAISDVNHPSLGCVRVWSIRGFPNHLIYYRANPSQIEILAVLHASRDAPAIFEQ